MIAPVVFSLHFVSEFYLKVIWSIVVKIVFPCR